MIGRVIRVWVVVVFAVVGLSCQTAENTAKTDEKPTEKPAATSEATPDPFAVAQAWADAPATGDLSADVRKRAKGWKHGRVARIWAATEGYRAIVHNYTTARDAPAVMLTIAKNASGQWTVVDAKLARSSHLWPEL